MQCGCTSGCTVLNMLHRKLSALHGHQARACSSQLCSSRWACSRQAPARSRLSSVAQAAKLGFGKASKQEEVEGKRGCPCGSGQLFKDCCKPYITSADGKFDKKPPTAEACLRARFSAYCTKTGLPLIVKTTAADNPARKGSLSEDGKVIRTFEEDIKGSFNWAEYKGLRILGKKEAAGKCSLKTEYQVKILYNINNGQPVKDAKWQTLHETACFVQEDGTWVFSGAEKINWDREKLQVVQT